MRIDRLVTINAGKTKSLFSPLNVISHNINQFFYDNALTDDIYSHKHLGVTLTSNLSWKPHILNIYEKESKRLNFLKGLKFKISREVLDKLYKSLIRPIMEYADVLWDGCYDNECELLESVQYEAAKGN